ncbi:hypothetical protein M422DRAFT_51267 [Sphaerobolus stellatus SS14]|uniref:Uncharacterized protein n=1 Tax=Sphaerobolus stellatus (strain SS14) TaxID=990650 RepID=A0A0C9VEF2_SPHS4|nr:hypothetical protein M422DRAFT_51267 [Sphaerobolus stellatus SS14]
MGVNPYIVEIVSDITKKRSDRAQIEDLINEAFSPLLPQDNHDAEVILWLFQTSTDSEVILSVINMVPHIQWLPHLNYTFIRTQMRTKLQSFMDQGESATYIQRNEVWLWMKACIHIDLPVSLEGNMPMHDPVDQLPAPQWSAFVDSFLQTVPHEDGLGLFVGNIIIISYILNYHWSSCAQLENIPPYDLLWVSHILPSIIRERDGLNQKIVSHIISKALQDPSDLIQAKGFLSLLLLNGMSADP